MPSAYIIKESSSCHAKTGLLVKGIDSPLKGTQKLCTVMKTGRNFPAKGLSMTIFNKLALDVLHHIFTPQQTRSPQNVSAEWADFTSSLSSILHSHLLAAPFIVVFSWRKVHFHIKWQDSSFRGWKCLWRALCWGLCKQLEVSDFFSHLQLKDLLQNVLSQAFLGNAHSFKLFVSKSQQSTASYVMLFEWLTVDLILIRAMFLQPFADILLGP